MEKFKKLKIITVICFIVPVLCGTAVFLAEALSWGFVDIDAVLYGLIAFGISGVICLPIIIICLLEMRLLKVKDNKILLGNAKIVTVKCPNCGANIVKEKDEIKKCDYCNSHY